MGLEQNANKIFSFTKGILCMKELLEESYRELLHKYGFPEHNTRKNVSNLIKTSLKEFIQNCTTPAIWCYGKHTKMLMTDFIFELKGVCYIIDKKYRGSEESGFQIIGEEDVKKKQIDGIIISSYIYKEEIKKILNSNFPDIKYLDIYDKLEEKGVVLSSEFFAEIHPYRHYEKINDYQRELMSFIPQDEKNKTFKALIEEFVWIKDFRSAIGCLERYSEMSERLYSKELLKDLQKLYELELKAVKHISERNVLMLCIDGMRRQDILNGRLPKLEKYISDHTCFFENAYSVSTSTYESLIPAYRENADLRTKYYESEAISENSCRFLQEAKKQNRNTYFYTDGVRFIDSDYMHVKERSQTATEKIWDFISDAVDESNGLFYIHILYESHYSFPNPYTLTPLVIDGGAILFDYLSRNGGKLRANYDAQQKASLQYLDDVLSPILEGLKCRMVLYADHGNIILEQGTLLEDVERTKLTFHEDWIQVPLAVKSPETGVGRCHQLCSIMDLNHIIICLMNGEAVEMDKSDFIKVVRSEIYNPDFKYLFKRYGYSRGLLPFEVFIFQSGYKLAIYSDGVSELYETDSDRSVDDTELKNKLLEKVSDKITVF